MVPLNVARVSCDLSGTTNASVTTNQAIEKYFGLGFMDFTSRPIWTGHDPAPRNHRVSHYETGYQIQIWIFYMSMPDDCQVEIAVKSRRPLQGMPSTS